MPLLHLFLFLTHCPTPPPCEASSLLGVEATNFIIVAFGAPTILITLFHFIYYAVRSKHRKLKSTLCWLKQMLELEDTQDQQETTSNKKQEETNKTEEETTSKTEEEIAKKLSAAISKGSNDKNDQDTYIEQATSGSGASIELKKKNKKKADSELFDESGRLID